MAVGSDPTPTRTRTTHPQTVPPRPNKRGEETQGHHRSADLSSYSPPLLTAFASGGASPEAEWEDDLPGAESEDDVAAADSEDEAEWAAAVAAAAAELADEAKWEDAAAAELADEAKWEDAAAAESEDNDAAAAAESEDNAAATAESEEVVGNGADTGEPDSPPRGWPSNSARRDPSKAELFRGLDAVCEARRLQETRLLKRPPPPAAAGDPDEPIWPPKSRHWRRFRELRATKSSPASPVLNPDDNSLSPPLSNKSKEMLSDKVTDEGDDTGHSSESASCQTVPYENHHEEKPLPVTSKKLKYSIDTYAVQCGKCWKWRLIPTKIKYDEIREKSRQVPFLCEHVHGWKPGVSCDDPSDISQDDGFWVIDRPCISQTPLGWKRTISIRREGCDKFADVYYIPPKGKKLRSMKDFTKYLQDNPDCAVGLHDSEFRIPERLQDYLKRCHRESKRKRPRQSKPLEPTEVLPLSCAPPIHEYPASYCVLALYDKGQYCFGSTS